MTRIIENFGLQKVLLIVLPLHQLLDPKDKKKKSKKMHEFYQGNTYLPRLIFSMERVEKSLIY